MNEIRGTLDHRILLNYRIDPDVALGVLPPEFTPRIVNGYAIGGICQVSLSRMRPVGFPGIAGVKSHNAAHRIAVESDNGEGVYVPRRDTNSWLNSFSGGRVFPGVFSKMNFAVHVEGDRYSVGIEGRDRERIMSINGTRATRLNIGSAFKDVDAVCEFFKAGSVGWSLRPDSLEFDAIELEIAEWRMEPMCIREEYSAFFSDETIFPKGSVQFDSALIMRDLGHRWVSRDDLAEFCCS